MPRKSKEIQGTFHGTYDAKKAMRLLAELYCKQEGYILEELTFASDIKQEEPKQE